MSNLAELAQAALALFPNQFTESGHEVQTHRVETSEDPKRPGELDVVIVRIFPDPMKRNEVTIAVNGDAYLSHPKEATDTAMAQLVAFRLQGAALGNGGPPITSIRRESTGLWGHSFRRTPLPVVEALPVPPPAPTGGTPASPGEQLAPASKRKPQSEVAV